MEYRITATRPGPNRPAYFSATPSVGTAVMFGRQVIEFPGKHLHLTAENAEIAKMATPTNPCVIRGSLISLDALLRPADALARHAVVGTNDS
jgi:hypothetical protein